MNEVSGLCNGDISDEGETCSSMKPQDSATVKNTEEFVKFLQNGAVIEKKRYTDDNTNSSWFRHYDNNMTSQSTFFLPFIPSLHFNFDNMTLALNATHPESGFTQYDTHSLYGHMQSKATWEILKEGAAELENFKDKRQFLLSRSTFSGSGVYTSHWLGNNKRTWDDLRYSISGIMNFNMFGIPHVGADVCGTAANPELSDDENKELCGRWFQLATFYPFARQHSDETGGLEPYALGNYSNMAVLSLQYRYKYLMFMYGCLAQAE
jgi:alpha-glucosidase (family GH31 glycosyl hydrolase)